MTLCKGNLSQKKVTQDCSLKSVVLITLGFNINMSFYDEKIISSALIGEFLSSIRGQPKI